MPEERAYGEKQQPFIGITTFMRCQATRNLENVDVAILGIPFDSGTSYQLLELVRKLKGLDLVGFDIVEVNPSYDHGEITSIMAANLAFEFLSLLAIRK